MRVGGAGGGLWRRGRRVEPVVDVELGGEYLLTPVPYGDLFSDKKRRGMPQFMINGNS